MASRNFNRTQALEKEVKSLFAKITIGATGAPTLTKGVGIASVARSAAGKYTITLDDTYVRLLHVDVKHLVSTVEDLVWQVTAETVSTTKTVAVAASTGGTFTDPSNGCVLLVRIDLKNTTAGE